MKLKYSDEVTVKLDRLKMFVILDVSKRNSLTLLPGMLIGLVIKSFGLDEKVSISVLILLSHNKCDHIKRLNNSTFIRVLIRKQKRRITRC